MKCISGHSNYWRGAALVLQFQLKKKHEEGIIIALQYYHFVASLPRETSNESVRWSPEAATPLAEKPRGEFTGTDQSAVPWSRGQGWRHGETTRRDLSGADATGIAQHPRGVPCVGRHVCVFLGGILWCSSFRFSFIKKYKFCKFLFYN